MTKHVRRNGGVSNSSSNPNRPMKNGSMRSKAVIKRLNMVKSSGIIRDKRGKAIGGDFIAPNRTGNQEMQKMARVAPNRRWFGNTRTIGQKELENFRLEMGNKVKDPYSVVLNSRKLPMGLLTESKKVAKMNLLTAESFESTFGPKKQRNRVKLNDKSLTKMVSSAKERAGKYDEATEEYEKNSADPHHSLRNDVKQEIFNKGQSARIWQELYKVLDCSDVVLQVLDARDPLGTRSKRVEDHLKTEAKHKHLIFILNKCDLVPTWVTKRWVRVLSAEYPTLAFHAHLNKPFGKGALIQLLRQFALLHPEKRQISVGLIGYPNSGKSSIINTLRSKKVCVVAPIPGQTKVWQYVTLFKRVSLIDCPGVVYPNNDSESEVVIKGVVRAEKLDNPDDYIEALLNKVEKKYIRRVYGIQEWRDGEDFLSQLCLKRGRLLKHGEPDFRSMSQRVIYDLQRGRIPYFVPPPSADSCETEKLSSSSPFFGELPVQDLDKLPQSQAVGFQNVDPSDDTEYPDTDSEKADSDDESKNDAYSDSESNNPEETATDRCTSRQSNSTLPHKKLPKKRKGRRGRKRYDLPDKSLPGTHLKNPESRNSASQQGQRKRKKIEEDSKIPTKSSKIDAKKSTAKKNLVSRNADIASSSKSQSVPAWEDLDV